MLKELPPDLQAEVAEVMEGDWRNWEQIRAWAAALPRQFKAGGAGPT